MKSRLTFVVWLMVCCVLVSCNSQQIIGLWEVERVMAAGEEVSPVARWVRIHPDGSQVSGNGWTQHSAGTWELDDRTGELAVINANGLDDPYGPFLVSWTGDTMQWKREENGATVTIHLTRTEKLPMAPADRLLGLWEMEQAFLDHTDVTDSLQQEGTRTLFFRWDNRFVLQSGRHNRERGLFVTHAHRNQLELIFNGEEGRQRWEYEAGPRELTLHTTMNNHTFRITYHRIRQFPE